MSLDTFDVDPFDADLSRRLQAAAPSAGSSDAVLEVLRPRLRHARQRRRAVMIGGPGLAAAAALAVVLTIAGPSGGGHLEITPATGTPKTTAAPEPHFTPPPTSPVPHSSSKGGGNGTSLPTTPSDGGGGTNSPAPENHTYTSDGGSITVRFADGALSLLSTHPATGFSSDVNDRGPTRVEVRFDDGTTEWQIRVDVINGHLSVEITSDDGGGGS